MDGHDFFLASSVLNVRHLNCFREPLKAQCELRWAALLLFIRLYFSHYVSGFCRHFAVQINS